MTDVIMPQMGESIAEGTIIKWYKQVGDRVERDEALFEISTDKVDTEIPAPAAGVLSEIRVGEGETVPINTVVAVIGGEGAASPSGPDDSVEAASATPPETLPEVVYSDASPKAAGTPAPSGSTGGPLRSSPLVSRIAGEHGVDLSQLTGTGRGGRITKNDILKHLAERSRKAAPAAAAEPAAMPAAAEPAAMPAAAQPAPAPRPAPSPAPASSPAPAPTSRSQTVPMTTMRRTIAEHMVSSRRTSAHVTTVFEADMTRVVKLREQHKAVFEQESGVKLTYTPFFVRAVLGSLKAFPLLNASIEGDNIVYHKDVHIGIAVALDGGLIVPVIRNADEKSFLGLARAVMDLAERARIKKLRPEEVQGGTFTLTNPGPYGALFGTPIINQPQVAILGLGGIHKRPVVVNDAIAVRSMVYLALSFDHRLIDGALADQFMADLRGRLQDWDEKVI